MITNHAHIMLISVVNYHPILSTTAFIFPLRSHMRAILPIRVRVRVRGSCTETGPPSSASASSPDRTELLDLLRTCSCLQNARILHHHALSLGYGSDTFLSNRLLLAYGSFGAPRDAEATIHRTWVRPNLYSWNLLINVYSDNGMLEKAWQTFHGMPCRDVVTWNAMMSSCIRHQRHDDALCLFWSMQYDGIPHNGISFMSALEATSHSHRCQHHLHHDVDECGIRRGCEIHGFAVRSGFDADVMLGNALIDFYGNKHGDVDDAWWVFSHMPHRDVASWTSMMSAYTQRGAGQRSLSLFCSMHRKDDGDDDEDTRPDKVAYVCALDACASVAALEDGRAIHASVWEEYGVSDFGVVLSTALVNMYGECNQADDARHVFSRMPLRNIVSWTAMLAALSKNGHGREALQLFYRMKAHGIEPNSITFAFALDACAHIPSLLEGHNIYGEIVRKGHEKDTAVSTGLVNLYGKCRRMEDARSVFDGMGLKSVVSWSNMIAACTENGFPEEALTVFHRAQQAGVEPNRIMLVCLVDACSNLISLQDGRAVERCISECGLGGDVMLGNSLVSMYGRCGSFRDADRVFHRLSDRTIISWSALVSSSAQNGHGREALAYLCEMISEGITPDDVSFTSVLLACSHSGMIDEAKRVLCEMMTCFNVLWTVDHFFCMVDVLARAGRLDEAEAFLGRIPFQNLTLPWLSLLGACRNYGDVDMGVHVAACCFEQNPCHSSAYTMLGNVFATDFISECKEAASVDKKPFGDVNWDD